MIDLAEYLRPDRMIVLGRAARDAIVRALLGVCLRDAAGLSAAARAAALDGAHQMKDQPLDGGFALTHARIAEGDEILLSVGLLGAPRPFGRGGLAHTVICALIPESRSREYLSLLARLSRLLTAPGAETAFRSADPETVARFVREFRT